jgi:hypothetical protein
MCEPYHVVSHEQNRLYRALAGGDDDYSRIGYSVLSVTVMTLGLIMMVEVLRHRLDHAAKGKPFFLAVLEGVYTERRFGKRCFRLDSLVT